MLRPLSAVAVVAALLWGCTAAEAADLVLRDDLQRDVTFARSPRRIVTLLPSLTETVCALDACDRLIATDRYSNWPAQVRGLPKTGGLDDAAVELIVGLRPDLVLLSRSQRITERFRELGLKSFTLNTETYDDIARNIHRLGLILDADARAAALERSIAEAVRAIGSQAAADRQGRKPPSVYFEVDPAPYAAGPESFIGELLARLGTTNIVTPGLGAYPKLNPEYVVRHPPDVIFVSATEAPHLAARPGWDQIRAVKEQRLCSFAREVDDTIVRPGPRVPEGMQALAACLKRVTP